MTMHSPGYRLSEHHDPDLWPLRDDPDALAAARARLCECGHPRSAHMAATGALGSFGGTACDLCWACPTFRPRGDR
jgi:hypothetical protein